jgi:putative oxidoreductase
MRLGIAILRAIVGGFFIGHGLQKLKALEGTAGGFESMGLKPGKVHATAAAAAETGGGALLVAGLATPAAAAALTGTMSVAIDTVHAAKGPWNTEGGYEYNAVLMAAVFAITAEGPGALSLDRREWGAGWAIAQLVAGVGGAAALLRWAHSQSEAEPEPARPEPAREPVSVN